MQVAPGEHVGALLKEMKRLREQNSEEVTREERHRHFEKEKTEATQEMLPGGKKASVFHTHTHIYIYIHT